MLKISFDFDETTNTVTNVTVDGIKKQKQKPFISSNVPDNEILGPDVEILDNKIQLSKSALVKLGVKADDRVSVQYVSAGIGKSFPVMGKSSCFTDSRNGNRVTAKGTVSFRGEKRDTLIEFGTVFSLESYSEGIWKLIPYGETTNNITPDDSLSEENSDMEQLNDTEIDNEIEEITSSMVDDDLPF